MQYHLSEGLPYFTRVLIYEVKKFTKDTLVHERWLVHKNPVCRGRGGNTNPSVEEPVFCT